MFVGPLSIARAFVSKNKRRYRDNGFDLDLSYITPRIIAMGFPAEGVEGMFRNPLSEVMSFLTKFHANHFKVFNLCAERPYEPAKLGGNVEWIPFADHNPAPTNVMLYFCERAHEWLSLNSNNIIAVHCKAGKGRTGMMISAYLLYSGDFTDPLSAMRFYGEQRTKNGKERGSIAEIIRQEENISFTFSDLWISGDVKIEIYEANSSKKKTLFYLWFNTDFIEDNKLSLMSKADLDKPPKNLEEGSQVHIHFSS